MSIATTTTKETYQGNASIVTAYPITFKYLEPTHVSVYFDGVLKQRGAGADYVLAGDGTINTGYITTNVAQPATVKVTIVLDVPFDQPVELLETGVLSADTLEEAYDRLNMQIRRVWRKVSNALTFSDDEGASSTGTADTVVGFDGDGNIVEIPRSIFATGASVTTSDTPPPLPVSGDLWLNSTTTQMFVYYNDGDSRQWVSVVASTAPVVTTSDVPPSSPVSGDLWLDTNTTQMFAYYDDGSSSQWVTVTSGTLSTDSDAVTYTPDGTGAVATTVEAKLRESVSVKDFGAVGDGVTDDTTAIQAAIDYAGTFAISGGASQADKNLYNRCTVFIPSGRYKVTSKITINSAGVHIKGAGIFGTQIEYTHNDDLFHFRSDDQFTTGRLHNVGVSEMSILGKYSNPTTGGSIRVGYVKHVYINDVKFNGGFDDIILEGTQEPVHIDRCDFFQDNNYTAQGTGNAHVKVRELEVDPTSANSMRVTSDSKHWAYSVNVNISQCEMRTATNGKQYGIYVKAVDGLYLSDTHLLNHSEQLFVGRASNVFPCSNIRVSNCFFDGESPNTLRNINVTSAEAAGATAPVDLYISDCKFNGVGDGGASPEYWMLISDKSIKHLSVSGCVFDKAQNATAAAIEISKGSGSCVLSNNTFIMEDSYVPAVIIRTNASNVVQADFFEKLIISGNRFIYQDTTDRANYNIRLANAQTETVIANNIYSDSLSGTDKLVYDTTTSGTTQGGAGTLNNISIA